MTFLLVLNVVIGLFLGAWGERTGHRKVCPCEDCTKWRSQIWKKAKQKAGAPR